MQQRNDRDEAFAHVVAGERGVLRLEEIVGLPVLVDRARERRAEAGQMRAAVGVRDRVGETENLVADRVVVLENDVEFDRLRLLVDDDRAFLDPRDAHGLGMHDLLVLAELLDEFLNAVLVEKLFGLRTLDALVGKENLEAGIEERELAEAADDQRVLELDGLLEDFSIGLEGDVRAG